MVKLNEYLQYVHTSGVDLKDFGTNSQFYYDARTVGLACPPKRSPVLVLDWKVIEVNPVLGLIILMCKWIGTNM